MSHELNPIFNQVLNDERLFTLLTNAIVAQILSHDAKNSFGFDAYSDGIPRHSFWANNLRPEKEDHKLVFSNKDGEKVFFDEAIGKFVDTSNNILADQERGSYTPRLRHHGHENLRDWGISGTDSEIDLSSPDDVSGLMVLNTFETQTGIRSEEQIVDLSKIETNPDLSSEEKNLICALQSLLYAKAAQGNVVTSVQGANPDSFFRTTEIYSIMNNPKITGMQIMSEDMVEASKRPDGIGPRTLGPPLDKKIAYHMLRKQWMDSAIEKYEMAQQNLLDASDAQKPLCTIAFTSAYEALRKEQEIAKYMYNEPSPFSKKGFYDKDLAPKYDAEDRKQEAERIDEIQKVLDKTAPYIMTHLEDERKVSEAKIQNYVTELNKKEMSDVDKILIVAKTIIESMNKEYAKDSEKIGKAIDSCEGCKTQEDVKSKIKLLEEIYKARRSLERSKSIDTTTTRTTNTKTTKRQNTIS